MAAEAAASDYRRLKASAPDYKRLGNIYLCAMESVFLHALVARRMPYCMFLWHGECRLACSRGAEHVFQLAPACSCGMQSVSLNAPWRGTCHPACSCGMESDSMYALVEWLMFPCMLSLHGECRPACSCSMENVPPWFLSLQCRLLLAFVALCFSFGICGKSVVED